MENRNLMGFYVADYVRNSVEWVCSSCNVRKRRFARILAHSNRKIDKELYELFMDSMQNDINHMLSDEQVRRLFKLAEGVPTSIIKPT